jgi:hypothetical protein
MVGLLLIAGVMTAGMALAEGDAATIVNSGSTNRAGFRIVVERSGTAVLTSSPRRFGARGAQPEPVRRTIPAALVDSFYAGLAAARPFTSLPAVHCAKSASFGSSLTIEFGSEHTPDLSCGDGGNSFMRDLIRDANQIVALLSSDR